LETWDCGYVGMTFVPASRRDDYFRAADQVLQTRGDARHVESILVELAPAPVIADISGHGWLEIDEPHERANADAVLARERWWAWARRSRGCAPRTVVADELHRER